MARSSSLTVTVFYLFLCLFPGLRLQAQLESSKWVFGHGVGLDFSSGKPVAFSGSKIKTIEGCSSISDNNGNLLFYTDGITVWNRNNEVMPNGTNLKGHISSTQSSIIVPKPGSKTLYYLFTVDSEGGKAGFSYSLLDLSKEKGLGDVILKNESINSHFTEKLTAVKHENRIDFWIIVHEYESDIFLAYLLTKNGLSKEPVVSAMGMKHDKSIYNTIGYMKVSSDKKKLALAINGNKKVQIFDFNAANGVISNPITISFDEHLSPYGIEFSTDNNLLYIGMVSNGCVYQINLKAGNEEAVKNSLIQIGKSNNNKVFGALQLAIDGKIYVAEYNSKFLSVVEKPDMPGKSCSFRPAAIPLNENTSMLGLPAFISDIGSTNKPEQLLSQIGGKKAELNKKYILSTVYFDFNESTLKENYFDELKQLADFLNQNRNLDIEITGHTDSIGSVEVNDKLSLARAREIGNYLTGKDIEIKRITFSGKGSNEPIDTNKTEKGRQRNRRVEFILKEEK